MSSSAGRPISLRNPSLVELIRKLYNFMHVDVNSIKSLPSYNDRIYYFRGIPTPLHNFNKSPNNVCNSVDSKCGQVGEYIFKMFNNSFTPFKYAEGYSAIWTYLQSKGFDCTEHFLTKQGHMLAAITAQELSQFEVDASKVSDGDTPFAVRVMKFIPGELFDHVDKKYLTPRVLYNVGAFVGKVDSALNVRPVGLVKYHVVVTICMYIKQYGTVHTVLICGFHRMASTILLLKSARISTGIWLICLVCTSILYHSMIMQREQWWKGS